MDTVGEPGVSPRGPSRERYARSLLPCSGSLGQRFPTFPTVCLWHAVCGTMIDYDCQKPVSVAFGVPSPPPIPCITPLALCPWALHRIVREAGASSPRRESSPTVGTPPPHSTHGDFWLSHVPRFPPCSHALVLDPGGVLDTRPYASRTAAFRTTARRRLSPVVRDDPAGPPRSIFRGSIHGLDA